ncbi:MAG: nucleoside hydrolase [Chthoniobacterales bacterium]
MTRLAVFLGALTLTCAATARNAVWIDTDPAIGAPWREVDDAFALILAFHSPELRIAGISTTYGNAPLRRTTEVARDLVRHFGKCAGLTTADIHAGARSPSDAAKNSDATEALARALREERLTYIALGPLTNLADFLKLHPTLAERIERVLIVGGRSPDATFAFGPNKSFSVHDANVFKDPAAVAAVLRSSCPLVLTPVEIAPQLALTPTDFRALKRGGPAGRYLNQQTRVWSWFWRTIVGEKGGLVFDVFAILPAVRSDLLKTETRFVAFDADGDLVAYREPQPGRRRIQFAIDTRPETHSLVLERLGAKTAE